MAIFSAVLLVVTVSVIMTDQRIGQLQEQQEVSESVERGADELNALSSQYFLYQETQQIGFWNSNITSVSGQLAILSPFNSEQQTLVNRAIEDLDQLNGGFVDLVSFLEGVPRNVSVRVLPEFQDVWSRVVTEHQSFALDASQLSDSLRVQADQLRLINSGFIVALLAIFGAFFVTIYFITYRRTLKSLSTLQSGIDIIGSGDLDYSINSDKKDEIGALSNSFNQMTANLKTVTASKKELEKEVVERKKAEEALRESEQRLRFHAENIPLAVVEWDRDFVVTRWAGDAEKIFGWTAAETIGKPIMDLHMIYEPDIPSVEKTMGRLTSGETKVVSSNRNITKDGRMIFCTWYNSVLLDDEGKMVSVFSFVEDYTARMSAERALEENNRNLERLVEERTRQLKDSERLAAIGQTAGMVGHDIRNPLQAILGDIYLVKEDLSSLNESEEKSSMQESVESIEKSIEYVNKIVADLQDFAKPLNPCLEETDLKAIIDELLQKNGLPEDVESQVKVNSEARLVIADPNYLRRIIGNLVSNAVQAMPNGGKLKISAHREKKYAVVAVEDTGLGVPEDAKGKLFTPLFTTKSKGQGFGLSVVKRLTEALNGTVSFESQVGKGTTFIIRLPHSKK